MLHLAFGKSSSQAVSLCLQPNIVLLEQGAPINGKATRWHLQAGFGSSCDPAVQLFARFSVFVFQQCRILRCVRVCLGKILQAPRMIALVEVVQNQPNL